MDTKIKKWGNSLAVRIPNAFVKESNLHDGSEVDMKLENGKLIIFPKKQNEFVLKDLLKKINKGNIHGEINTGEPVGVERW
ncbi:AbrB/MazE/SpoVT family DNA-binding domain-containing protein [bacterium]|nr:AbrB/MazE/SpoVT family DNA-binding domain-containing protein [bacterium]